MGFICKRDTKNVTNWLPYLWNHPYTDIFKPRIDPNFLLGALSGSYNEVIGTMKITLLYQVSHYIRVKE